MTQYAKASAFGGGSASVITTRGDLIRGDSSGADERLALGTSGYVLTSDGTDAAWAAATVGDVVGPASAADNAIARYDSTTGKLIQNSSATIDDSGNLTANNVTGTNTGDQTFDGLSPMTTGGDIIYGGASGTGTRLANGAAGQVLTSAGTTVAPAWATPVPGLAVEFYTHATLPATLVVGIRYVVDISGGNGAATMPTISGTNDGEVIEVVAINIPASGTIVLTAPSGNFNDIDLGTDTTFEINVSQARFILNNTDTTYEVQDDYWALGSGVGFNDPMTTRGDVIIRDSSNVTARLALGTNTQVLTSDGSDVTWSAGIPGPVAYHTITSISSDVTLADDSINLVDTSAARSLTLPTPVSGLHIKIKDKIGTASTYNITIVRAASEKIEGVAASKILQSDWGSWEFISDGTDWFVL